MINRLFSSRARVEILKLFLFNPEKSFSVADIGNRVKEDQSRVRRELNMFEKIGLVKKKSNGKKKSNSHGFMLDSNFTYLVPLQNFLVNIEPLSSKELIKKISKLGSIKLIITAGVFIQEFESRADILIVGDNIKKGQLDNTIKVLESEIGKELKYAQFTTEDFKYRLSMCDKLTRDILDYPHKKILNKLGAI